jgi:hypothetical protein
MVNYTAYLVIKGKTPIHAFIDQVKTGVDYTPSVSHLQVLGYKVYMLIKKER